MEAVKDVPGIKFYTSLKPGFGCAIGVVGFEQKHRNSELEAFLFNEYKIHVTTINWENVHGVRITPNVYTTTKDLDRLITALREYGKA
jgi:selenocysteine lyase/cysteine desulfurase